MTFASWARVAEAKGLGRAVILSLAISVGASALLVALSVMIGRFAIVARREAAGPACTLCLLPVTMPNIVVGLALLWTYIVLAVSTSQKHFVLILA